MTEISKITILLWILEYISDKDKRRLQNVMAYGELGKDINDEKPKRRTVPQERQEEPEIDRFDEGRIFIKIYVSYSDPFHMMIIKKLLWRW